MTTQIFMSLALYLLHAALLPFLLVGAIRLGKARLQMRQGPPLWQPLWDFLKMMRKGETVSQTTTWVFRSAPLVNVACVLGAALMVPWLGVATPLHGDLFLVVYLLGLGKFATGLAALDTGSSFGALGASREATVSIQAEPALVLGLAALAAHSQSSSFAAMLEPARSGLVLVLIPLVTVALALAAVAELARMPVDDPTTHLELTMIHEAMILDNSGRNLAFVEYGVGLKTCLLLGLLAQVLQVGLPVLPPVAAWAGSILLIGLGALVLVIVESTLVKLRWRRIPNLLSFALAAGVLACLLVALKG